MIEMFGDNFKVFKMVMIGMFFEMVVVELFFNIIFMFDFIFRFSISYQKKRFCRKFLNIIEFMIEILIFFFVLLEFFLDYEEVVKYILYEFLMLF